MQTAVDNNYLANPHAVTTSSLFALLFSNEQGLDEAEARHRRKFWGVNQLPEPPPIPGWRRWLRQFHNLFIYVLMASGLVSLLLGHWVDAGVIAAVILINASIGFVQEGKAEAALRAIKSISKSFCLVIRQGTSLSIDSSLLVPGDVVMLEAGDRVPADLRLFFCKDLRCDEALLTGESQPVTKTPLPLSIDIPIAEQNNMAFMGTMVSFGSGRGMVVNTGPRTQLGKINQLVQQVTIPTTPLQDQLASLAKQLTQAILVITFVTILIGFWIRHYSFSAMLQAAIGIAVAAIPEGLPAIVTIALALGVKRMAHNHALVRRLASVEVLGSVDIICTDKTGTLTTNAMTARSLITSNSHFKITGEGYNPGGSFQTESEDIHADKISYQREQLNVACRIALLCNQANLTHEKHQWQIHGDPTEGALLVMALKQGLTLADTLRTHPKLDTLPFESEKRYMASLHLTPAGTHEMLVKGAPDRILASCQQQMGPMGNEPLNSFYWHQQLEKLARQGMRVLGLAYKPLIDDQRELTHKDMEHGLIMVALVGISDPPRPEAKAAIASCHQARIRVLMITGDNPVTASAIGQELGLDSPRVVTGAELDAMTKEEFKHTAQTVNIFARTSPANKLQLVQVLQAQHHTVAMTGDGVNDAPALRCADIGVAMGLKGTDAAREASAFILTDDNFATIAHAVAEGRTIYDNIRKSIAFILPTDLAEASIIVLAILMGWLLPITPVQILWINTITAVTLTLALVFESGEANIMQRPPRPRQQGLMNLNFFYRILLVGSIAAATVFSLFSWSLQQGATIEKARTIAVNALVIFECFYLLSARTFYDSLWHKRYWKHVKPTLLAILAVVILQIGFTYLPASQKLFAVTSLGMIDWLVLIAASSPIVLIIELEKILARRWITP